MSDVEYLLPCYTETLADKAAHGLMRVAGWLIVVAFVLYGLSSVYRMGLEDAFSND